MLSKKLFFFLTRGVFFVISSLYVAIFVYLLYKGWRYCSVHLISSELLAPLEGTVLLVLMSILIATPLGIATGIYIHSYAKGRFRKLLDFSFEVLASTPSIVIGLFGFSILLMLHNFFENFRSSLFLASLSLSFLVLPYIVKATQLGLEEVSIQYTSIAYSLGGDRKAIILKILLPLSKNHIIKGIFLAIARSAEDTAVIMLTGAVASYGGLKSIFSPFEALPFYIYYTSANYSNDTELDTIFVAVLLLMMISVSFMLLVGRVSKERVWSR